MTIADKIRLTLAEPLGRAGKAVGVRFTDPLFIVGTGRCGSSLLARILDSHPRIVAFPNEANHLWHPRLYPYSNRTIDCPPIEADARRFTEASLASWPSGHAERIRRVLNGFYLSAGKSRTFFVKSAMVSFLLPQLVSLFPAARFIHIYRYGPSVVRSALRKNAANRVRKESWAGYWNDCIVEIDRAKRSLDLEKRGAFLECSYESLCAEPVEAMSRIAAYLDVDERRFAFDLSKIQSKNYKATEDPDGPWIGKLLSNEARYPAMRLKGYLA